MKATAIALVLLGCHAAPTPVRVQPPAAPPHPEAPTPFATGITPVTVPRSDPAAIAMWDAAWQSLRTCLLPSSDLDPRDAFDIDSTDHWAREHEPEECMRDKALAAAVPDGQTRLAALVAELAKSSPFALRSQEPREAFERDTIANLLRDIDDVTVAIHRAAGLPATPALSTKRVPLATDISPPLAATGHGGELLRHWMDAHQGFGPVVEHDVWLGREVVINGPELVWRPRQSTNSGVEAPSGTWLVEDAYIQHPPHYDKSDLRVIRDDAPDAIIPSPHPRNKRLIGDAKHRAIVAEGESGQLVFGSDDGGVTWSTKATIAGRVELPPSSHRTIDLLTKTNQWIGIDEHATILPPVAVPPNARALCASEKLLWLYSNRKLHWIERGTGRTGEIQVDYVDGPLACANDAIAFLGTPNEKQLTAVRCTPRGCSAPAPVSGRYLDVTSTGIASADLAGRVVTLGQPDGSVRRFRVPDDVRPVGFAVWDGRPSVVVIDEQQHFRIARW